MYYNGDIFAWYYLPDINNHKLLGELSMMHKIMVVFPAALIAFLLLVSFQSRATTYYVDKNKPNASDSNPGTQNEPWATIQKGIDVAQAGDTVFINSAVYNEQLTMKRSGNTSEGYITFVGTGNPKPVIDGTGKSDKLINWKGVPDGGEQKNYIVFDGFEIKNASKWAFWIEGDHNIIKNCEIHETGHTAVQLITGSFNTFSNNEIYNTGWNAISWESNNSGTGIRADHNIIEHNYLHNIDHHNAVNGFPHEGSGNWDEFGGVGNIVRFNTIINCLQGIYVRYEKDMEIYGNLIVNIFGYQGIHFHVTSGDNSSTYDSNSKIYNNIIANCQQNGIFNTNAKNLDIKNNIFYNNTTNGFSDIEFKSGTESADNILDYNLYYGETSSQKQINLYGTTYTIPEIQALGMETHGFFANPLFTDEQNDNFKPLENSPAIDAGLNLGSPYNFDIAGVSRPQGSSYDIGAYEIVTGPDTFPPEVTGAVLLDSVTLKISFSEALEQSSAENINNYIISNGISVNSANLDGSNVTLSTSVHAPGNYTVTVSNVTDLAGNIISGNNSADYEMISDPTNNLIQFDIVNVVASVVPEPEHSPDKTIDGITYGDGDPDSRWAGEPMPEWLQYDLGTTKTVSLLKFSFYNWNNGRVYHYSVKGSNDANQWFDILTDAVSSTEEWTLNEITPVEVRYIKVIFNSSNQNNWAGLWEAQIWGENPTSVNDDNNKPEGFNLEQNFPNPFNPSTTIQFTLTESKRVVLNVFNSLGELVRTIVDGQYNAGNHEIVFNAADLSSGVYFYKLQTDKSFKVKKMILQK